MLVMVGIALLIVPVSASSWMSLGAGDLTLAGRETAAYGAVSLPDGGLAWIEMTEPVAPWVGHTWTPAPQYWRVVRADAEGTIVWRSDEIAWQRASMTYDGGTPMFSNAEERYSPKLTLLSDGNLLAYDSVQHAIILRAGPAAASPARSWLREIDADSGATVWEREISGWSITGLVEAPGGGFWAAAVSTPAWYKSGVYWRVNAERTYILALNGTGAQESAWRIHTDAYRQHTSSYPFNIAPVAGSDGEYWVYGWRSVGQTVYGSDPGYLGLLRPSADRVRPADRTGTTTYPETHTLNGHGCVPSAVPNVGVVSGYGYGRPEYPMRLSPVSDGGAIITYHLQHEETYRLTRIAANGTATWSRTYVSPLSGEQIPVLEAVEVAGGYLAILQDGGMIRLSRLDAAGAVLESVIIGDPAGTTLGKRLTAAPSGGHPYGCIITGSTSGFGAAGTDALVVRLEDLEDVIWLGSGSLTLDATTAYAAEEANVTTDLVGAAWQNATYWVSVTGEDGTLYETWDLANATTAHTLSTLNPPGNYTLTLRAYWEEYEVLQTLATATLQRLDVGEVHWDRNVTYLGEQAAIGYSYVPDYDRYSYWIEIRDPSDIAVERHRLPTAGAIRPAPTNMTEVGAYTAELFAVRKADDHRIPGNTSTLLISDETWLYGTITDIYLSPIPGALVEVQQPTHPDPEVAGAVLTGTSGPDGSYEVSGLVPRYPATVTVSADGYYDHEETITIDVSGKIHYPARLTAIPPPPLPEIGGTAVYPPRNNPAPGLTIVLQNATTTLTAISDSGGHFNFPDLAPDVQYSLFARNATGHKVSEVHTYALSRGQTADLLLLIRDESLLPRNVAFSADPTSGGGPLRVSFQATGEGVDSYHWDFGDGATGSGQSTSHAYGPGTYSVTLTAENHFGVREVVKERLISVSGGGISIPAQVPARFIIQAYGGQRLANVTVTATPLESTGPWAWLLDLFGISGDADINGTVLAGTTGTDGGIVLPLLRPVKYQIDVTDASRGIDTSITIYPQEDAVVISVWPQEPAGAAGDFCLYAEEEGDDIRVGVRYAAADLTRITFGVQDEAGAVVYTGRSAAPEDDLSYLLDGEPGEAYTYGYVAETRTAGELRQDQYIRFALEARPWVDLAPWIPRGVYHWSAIFLIIGFAWTFGRGEIRGALFTIPILAGTLWLIGWLQVPWLVVGGALVIGILIYMRMSEGELQI